MAIHAGAIPRPDRVGLLRLRRHEERLRNGRPHLLRDYVGEWKLFESAALSRLGPQDLEIVRAGQEHDLIRRTIIRFA